MNEHEPLPEETPPQGEPSAPDNDYVVTPEGVERATDTPEARQAAKDKVEESRQAIRRTLGLDKDKPDPLAKRFGAKGPWWNRS